MKSSYPGFSQSVQQPHSLAMIASVAAHGIIAVGLALLPASGEQNKDKTTRVVRLLPSIPAAPSSAIDPNAPPPIPGIAGLPANLTDRNNLPDILSNPAGNSANDPASTTVTNLPGNFGSFGQGQSNWGQRQSRSTGFPASPVPDNSNRRPPTDNRSAKSDQQDKVSPAWNPQAGKSPELEAGKAGPLPPPDANVPNSPVALNSTTPPGNPSGSPAGPSSSPPSTLVSVGTVVTRQLTATYPQAACKDRAEGDIEIRSKVGSSGSLQFTTFMTQSNSDTLNNAAIEAVKIYGQGKQAAPEELGKVVRFPFSFRYDPAVCTATPNIKPTQTPPSTPNNNSGGVQPQQSNTRPSATPVAPSPSVAPSPQSQPQKTDNSRNSQNSPLPQPTPATSPAPQPVTPQAAPSPTPSQQTPPVAQQSPLDQILENSGQN